MLLVKKNELASMFINKRKIAKNEVFYVPSKTVITVPHITTK
jgi:hypothetical protein